MPHTLKNDKLEVRIDVPNENYQGTRFDWSGKIIEAKFEGITFGTTELPDLNGQHEHGRGFYNEFGIDSPLGFDETTEGDWFHKIGVGMLKKCEDVYFFAHKYELRPCDFTIQMDTHRIQFEHSSKLLNGYAYRLKKKIELVLDGFKINYFLENTGDKPIQTDEYSHNFLAIENYPMGEDYVLKFPFDLDVTNFGEKVNPENCIQFKNEQLGFAHTPDEVFFFSALNGAESVKANWKLENSQRRVGIQETGDFVTEKINLWGLQHVISPELFYKINVAPGESARWTRNYKFYKFKP